jgi:HAD superfamily hydrolase (TIGR01549 family)
MISFKGKKIIIFDLDGTIIDLAVDWQEVKNFLRNRYSEIYTERCEFDHISACLDYIVEKGDKKELKNFFKILEDFELKNIDDSLEIKETTFFINNLNLFDIPENINLAIFSLNTRKAIKKSLKMVNLYKKFDYVIGREDVLKWKPNPEGLIKIRNKFKVMNEEMIYFGDLEKDLLTGKNAGVETYLIKDIINLVKSKKQELGID